MIKMPSSSTYSSSPTSSGIATTPTGARHIPSSTRPDGSVRKEIKIRPGYRPPEDVEIYKNRPAEAWKTRGNRGGVPGATGVDSDLDDKGGNSKNVKRREARKKAKEEKHENGEVAAEKSASPPKEGHGKAADAKRVVEEEPVDPDAEKAKQVRTLKKKLRQAKDLREKKDKGDSLLPEQIGKIVKINELVRQLEGLGVTDDDEEEPKQPLDDGI